LSRNKGKTVIVITHTLQNIHLFDKIIFLAPGGKLCFYGTPEMAKKFFGVSNLSDAYEIISKDVEGIVKKYDKYRRAF
jgi:ABC-type multidrug transport system ATPase subunit